MAELILSTTLNEPFDTQEITLMKINKSGGGGGAGGGSVLKGTGNPNGVVTSTVTNALFYDPVAGTLWEFNGVANTNTGWVQIF